MSTADHSEIRNPQSEIEGSSSSSSPSKPDGETPTSAVQDSAIRNPQSAIDDFARLAALPPAEYDRIRKAEAKRLGLRLATLDDEVDRCRDRMDEAEAAKLFLVEPEPWPEPIADPPALFDSVHDRFVAYSYLPGGAPVVLSMFLGHTHAFPAFHYTPRINILSAKETCGKSTTVKVIASMAPRPFRVQNLRPPVVYRIIDKRQPVVLLDEVETYLPLYRELLGLLNAGNSSDACVPRCEGGHVHVYKAFAPVVLAGIGDLFRTLRSRSILIHMVEAPEGVALTRFDSEHLELEKTLARKLARWALDNLKAIAACDPALPKGIRNRVADNWRPLFQIAHVVGGHWPTRVTEAFHALSPSSSSFSSVPKSNGEAPHSAVDHSEIRNPQSAIEEPSTIDHQLLLSDIRAIFNETAADKLFSRDLLARLAALPSRPWRAILDSEPHPHQWLARQLLPFGIRPRTIWVAGAAAKGYLRKNVFAADGCFTTGPGAPL